jgi:hypothetical protein
MDLKLTKREWILIIVVIGAILFVPVSFYNAQRGAWAEIEAMRKQYPHVDVSKITFVGIKGLYPGSEPHLLVWIFHVDGDITKYTIVGGNRIAVNFHLDHELSIDYFTGQYVALIGPL